MVPVLVLLALFASSYLPILHSSHCQLFNCGQLGDLMFPYTQVTNPACGLFMVNCANRTAQLENGGRWYKVDNISGAQTIFIKDDLSLSQHQLDQRECDFINNFPRFNPKIASFQILLSNITMLKCDRTYNISSPTDYNHYRDCNGSSLYISHRDGRIPDLDNHRCSTIQVPAVMDANHNHSSLRLKMEFAVRVLVSVPCIKCHFDRGGECEINRNGDFECANAAVPSNCKINGQREPHCDNGGSPKIGGSSKIALGCGLAGVILILLAVILVLRRYGINYSSPKFHHANTSNSFTLSEIELGNIYLGVPTFSYSELEQATDNFASEKELGDGGYGVVYYGKLKDGREVAVKRLYEHNCKRVDQFLNEIEILTRLRHRNLVSLYGCSSRRSRELILIYEYIPNGTLADHLHGDQSKSAQLTWSIRIRIAIETAAALAYLHASDIIHRDVKTHNILLDNNFFVKVADFGISRLFPNGVTHISTAPQGTPGYVDPEYYHCYQLTEKSDVYSFGVVLIELISSLPAVDITRQRNEINLADLAIKKIQICALDELIDPWLGYRLDEEVKRMTTSVAELAFLCLHHDKEMRPTMDVIVEQLKKIESGEYE